MRSSLDFIKKLYSQQCAEGDYIILSVKGLDIKWRDVPIRYHKKDIGIRLKSFFKEYPSEKYDLYWSPMPYSGQRRRLENTLDTKFLAQDIDEYDNIKKLDPIPSYIWESSPNKYQGLWELDRYISEKEYTPLNKALAQHIGCDDCFDFCHVYRIPGTLNHKYKNNPKVKLPLNNNKIYKPKLLRKLLRVADQKSETQQQKGNLVERGIYAKYSIPQKVRDLLALEDLEGVDRSNTIWYIENKLNELGMSPNEIIHLVKNSSFNKYKGRKDEDRRLRQELDKIITGEISTREESLDKEFEVSSFETMMGSSNTFEGWLVKGFWGRRSHGIVAGMPKCFKSTLVHDLVVSVASGRPFLGKYPVLDPGPVLVIQNENADYMMKDRTEKLLLHRDLQGKVKYKNNGNLRMQFPTDLPISFINQQGFVLSNAEHRKGLEKLVKIKKPVLIVLDPLYLMFEGDLNSAKDLNPILNWLLYLKNEYKTSVMLIHHYNKGTNGGARGGSRMMGSIILYGWIESAWYLSKEESEESSSDSEIQESNTKPTTICMSREFRMSGAHPDLDISLALGEVGNPHYDVDVVVSGQNSVNKKTLKQDIVNLIKSSSIPVSARALCEALGINKEQLNKVLDLLIEGRIVKTTTKGYVIYKSKR